MKILKWLDLHLEEAILTVCLCVLTILTSVSVTLRYVFNSSLIWSEEICKWTLVYSTFFSIGWWIRRKNGICMDAFVQLLPQKLKLVLSAFIHIFLICFLVLAFNAAVKVNNIIIESEQISAALQVSMAWASIAPVAGFALALFRALQVVVLSLMDLRKEHAS
jgi:TRAP-type C4-dicarboxylate transport system permease small subunit